jgi:hypothetical protein
LAIKTKPIFQGVRNCCKAAISEEIRGDCRIKTVPIMKHFQAVIDGDEQSQIKYKFTGWTLSY